jgi:hypothetical protein
VLPGSTSSSARTTSARCLHSSTARGTTAPPRSRSSRVSRCSPRRCRPAATRPTAAGSPSRWGATTRARSASFPACGARKPTAVPATSSPRSRRSWSRASSRSRCSART